MTHLKPSQRPQRPYFSSGPCAKRPDWSLGDMDLSLLGRSHRSKPCQKVIAQLIDQSRKMLKVPDDYALAIVPASDTGAFEMAMWSLLGHRGVDALAWESFGQTWVKDMQSELKLKDLRVFQAPYGSLPDLSQVSFDRDVVFTWNGTTSGVSLTHGDWIDDQRKGLTLCDATSAVFCVDMPWHKLDVVTYSWQKVLGGEGAHGVIVLSPAALSRLQTYTPPWPLPKILRLAQGKKINEGLFKGQTINTPSMLCILDALDAVKWFSAQGGVPWMMERCQSSFSLIQEWLDRTPWAENLAKDPDIRSKTSVCFTLDRGHEVIDDMVKLLSQEGVAYDIKGHRDAPPSLRIWCGASVNPKDIKALIPWIEWAYKTCIDSCVKSS